jgi:hypothetical protein
LIDFVNGPARRLIAGGARGYTGCTLTLRVVRLPGLVRFALHGRGTEGFCVPYPLPGAAADRRALRPCFAESFFIFPQKSETSSAPLFGRLTILPLYEEDKSHGYPAL